MIGTALGLAVSVTSLAFSCFEAAIIATAVILYSLYQLAVTLALIAWSAGPGVALLALAVADLAVAFAAWLLYALGILATNIAYALVGAPSMIASLTVMTAQFFAAVVTSTLAALGYLTVGLWQSLPFVWAGTCVLLQVPYQIIRFAIASTPLATQFFGILYSLNQVYCQSLWITFVELSSGGRLPLISASICMLIIFCIKWHVGYYVFGIRPKYTITASLCSVMLAFSSVKQAFGGLLVLYVTLVALAWACGLQPRVLHSRIAALASPRPARRVEAPRARAVDPPRVNLQGEHLRHRTAVTRRVDLEPVRPPLRTAPGRTIETDDCSICLDTLASNPSQTLHCGHQFHQECVTQWLKRSSQCPICRAYCNRFGRVAQFYLT